MGPVFFRSRSRSRSHFRFLSLSLSLSPRSSHLLPLMQTNFYIFIALSSSFSTWSLRPKLGPRIEPKLNNKSKIWTWREEDRYDSFEWPKQAACSKTRENYFASVRLSSFYEGRIQPKFPLLEPTLLHKFSLTSLSPPFFGLRLLLAPIAERVRALTCSEKVFWLKQTRSLMGFGLV